MAISFSGSKETGKGVVSTHGKTVVSDAEIASVIDSNGDDMGTTVIALAGKMDTSKSGVLCDFISRLPEGKVCPILDFDHSILPIINQFYKPHRSKFIVINATSQGKDYKKGLMVGLAALEKVVEDNKGKIGLLASEGMDRLLQRSFKMTCQARGYELEDLKFFGKGGDKEFSPMDWMIRNDYNVDPFDLLYNMASDLDVDLILTTHTEDKIDNKHQVTEHDTPIWFKTIPDYLTYLFTMKRVETSDKVERVAVCDKSRIMPGLKGRSYVVSTLDKKTGMLSFTGLYDQIRGEAYLHI
jgi:hypothetical protein